jgi:hypothetical protein
MGWAGGTLEVFVNEEGKIRTFTGEYRVAAKVITQVGTYYATSDPVTQRVNTVEFDGVNSENIHDGYYPSPSLIYYHGAYAIEYV